MFDATSDSPAWCLTIITQTALVAAMAYDVDEAIDVLSLSIHEGAGETVYCGTPQTPRP